MPRATSRRSQNANAKSTSSRAGRPTVSGLGDEVGAAQLGRRVAESVRELRQERRLSLDQLAEASGVSRAALSQIESARTNPTLTILWKVAVGLGVPFQSLLGAAEGGRSRILRAPDVVPLRSPDGRMESRLVSPAGSDRVEIYELRFEPQGSLRSEPHSPHSKEIVIVLTGVLRITVGDDEAHELRAGDSLLFQADVRHTYQNPTQRESRCIDVITYAHA